MNLSLTPGQYRKLLILAHLGEWTVNAFRKDPDAGFEKAASTVYAQAREAGLEHWVDYDAHGGMYYPSADLEREAHQFIEEYDDETFWEELVERLAWRDLERRLGKAGVDGMPEPEREEALDQLTERYWREFEAHGIERLLLSKSPNPSTTFHRSA